MIVPPLPYEGYSWNLTQHASGFNHETITGMLQCAYPFQGKTKVGAEITKLMVEAALFTPNVRDGKQDAWRDYQQVLPELGLIYSTKVRPALKFTQVSSSFVAGAISFQNMIDMQVMSYQYPNGLKHDISQSLKSDLAASGVAIPSSLIELQITHEILVKPAVLIAQVMLGLIEKKSKSTLTFDECRAFILPCKKTEDWERAVDGIIDARTAHADLKSVHFDKRRNRNLQDWFKMLNMSSFFSSDGKSWIDLTEEAKSNLDALKSIFEIETKPESYWIPMHFAADYRASWFDHFGSISSGVESLCEKFGGAIEKPLAEPAVFADPIDEDDEQPVGRIALKPYSDDDLFSPTEIKEEADIKALAASLRSGAMKRLAKAKLHDEIVKTFAKKYLAQGAKVLTDRNSVDLFVDWPGLGCAVFEVKTVNSKNLSQRLRLAVGQVKEYAFRMDKEAGIEPEQCIIIDRKIDESGWRKEFVTEYLSMGLITETAEGANKYPFHGSKTSKNW